MQAGNRSETISHAANAAEIRRMKNIEEIRRDNLLRVIEEDFDGVKSRLAEALGVQPAQITRYFVEGTHGRNVGSDIARRIESITARPEGWMDAEHLDTELLEKAISGVEALLSKLKFDVDAKRRAKLIRIAYEDSLAAGRVELKQVRVIVGAMR